MLRAQERRDNGEPAQRDEGLANGSLERVENLDVQQAQIERDSETGRIVRIIDPGDTKPNQLNDPLAELDSDKGEQGFNQHASNSTPSRPELKPKTDGAEKLEQAANRPAAKHRPKQMKDEQVLVAELVKNYRDDYRAMTGAMEINYMQRGEGDLKRRERRWKDDGGTLDW